MSTEPNASESRPTDISVRILRPSLVVLCGPAASGKTTFAERHFRPTQIISSDRARGRVCDDERDQRFSVQAFELVHFLIEQRLTLNRLCVVDSTALGTPARKELLELARRFRVPTVAILFDVPLETCVARDEKRERSVGREVVGRHFQNFELAKSAIRQEGFDQILELRNDDAQNVKIEVVFRPIIRAPQKPQKAEGGGYRRSDRPNPVASARWNGGTARPSHAARSKPYPDHSAAQPAAPPAFPAKPKAASISTADRSADSLVESHVMGSR